jgi:4-hydroxyacetophenone monooxygenase
MDTTVDSTFIRRAVEVADLNAVRVALYQQTGDPELAQLPTTVNLDEAQRELLITKAVAWLEHNAGPARVAEPEEAELRTLLNMATAEEMGDLEFAARRDLPAFKDFPWTAEWTDGKPELPEGFKVAIIGSGFSGLAMGVQPGRAGWGLDHQSLPRCPRRHHFHHL